MELEKLKTNSSDILIIEESAEHCWTIGMELLNDPDGVRVRNILSTARDNQVDAIRGIYIRWLEQDENKSWDRLIHCFENCGLASLANRIKQHFHILAEGIYRDL